MANRADGTIGLSRPPRIVSAGRSTHGDRPVERYVLDEVWCLHWYRYRFTLEIDGRAERVEPGTVSLLRPGLRLVYRYPRAGCRHHFCLFTLPGRGLALGPRAPRYPAFTDGDALSSAFFGLFDRVVDDRVSRPGRAKAALWEMLWRLTDAGHAEGVAAQGPAEMAALQIRTRLSEPLRVADLAEEVGLSHNQLTRRFRARYGQTVVSYLQEQRLSAAERMLCETTLPMKMIALSIGLNAQQFNKAVRRGLGMSPTAVRERGRRKA